MRIIDRKIYYKYNNDDHILFGLIPTFVDDDDKEDEKEDCPVCDGTGGSMGNKDPKDDWVCFACDGTGKKS